MGSLPKDIMTKVRKRRCATLKRQDVVPCNLPHLTVEGASSVRHQNFWFTEALRVDQDLPWPRVARVIFEFQCPSRRRERHPYRFATPAAMQRRSGKRQNFFEKVACTRSRAQLQSCDKAKVADTNFYQLLVKPTIFLVNMRCKFLAHEPSTDHANCLVQESLASRFSQAVHGEPHHRILSITHRIIGQ